MRIALTFDDGPHVQFTPALLDLASEARARLSFFVVGKRAACHREILANAVAHGHEIGNHSWSHPDFAELDDVVLKQELAQTGEVIRACGGTGNLIRPPYGSLTPRQRLLIEADAGHRVVLWNVDSKDWKLRSPQEIAHRVLTQVRNGTVVLAHDIHATTVEAMIIIFPALLALGYQLVTVSEIEAAHPTLERVSL